MKAKKLAPIPMESILNGRSDIRKQMGVFVREDDRQWLYDQYEISDDIVDEVLKCAHISASVDVFNKTITPVVWEED
ncbi:hypothetical protein [Companilactobacillus alimentarius]|uniref:hypothetical protein n=1 Tax=Companilactobacillus alimentarius TaxID=1602 RepID=UPI0028B5842F|nr:hypothetical protein [Companilactobacillus alimentarius]MDT6953587.1 hypothetical protein [Companilactobacillus alimentarius]MDT6953657.1 hypothetical protein [Companilactobacillus alimentarius]